MSTKFWDKIDKFYIVVFVALIVLGVLVVLSVRTIYSSIQSLNATDNEAIEEIGINIEGLNEAIKFLNQNTTIPLDL